MRIWRRGFIGTENQHFLEANHIKYKPCFSVKYPTRIQNYMFEVPEDNCAWPGLKVLLKGDHTFIHTEFTSGEISQAEWCIILGDHSIEALCAEGYGWHRQYYADQCSKCGSGWRQIAPFRIKKEPKLGKNQFSSFGSGFELFCTPLVLDEFDRQGISGFETRPIILDKEDRPIQGLKQLVVNAIAEPAIAEELVEHERYSQTDCPLCGRTWHADYVRGMLPLRRAALKPNTDFQLTDEWFGSGANARREILVSQRVVRAILENEWKGAELIPIQAV